MNKLYTLLLLALVGLSKTGFTQVTQSVNISVAITPPYSPFYSDYSGANAAKVLLTVQNLSSTQKTIKLAGQLNGNNGIRITTKSNYVPLQPILLNPNETKLLNGLALKDIFDLNTLNVYGVDKAKIVQTARLPEGNYTFCIQAQDYNTSQLLSSSAPLGCTNISIAYPDAPILINPLPNMEIWSTQPQSVVFNWMNAGFVPMGTQYLMQVAEMPAAPADPNQVLNATSFPYVQKTLSSTSYVLSPADPPLKIGKRYAWRVKASDPSGRVVFKNNGLSQASIFIYQAPQITLAAPVLITPKNNIAYQQLVNISGMLAQPELNFKWDAAYPADLKINYRVKIARLDKEDSNPAALFANNSKLLVDDVLTKQEYRLLDVSEMAQNPMMNKPIQIGTGIGRARLEPGARYAVQVVSSGKDLQGRDIIFNNFGQSNISVFTYEAAVVKPKPDDKANYTIVTGRLFYRFKKENEQPVNTSFQFPPDLVTKKTGNISLLVKNTAPLPDFICHNMFSKGSDARPLKNAKIKLVYAFLTSTVANPTQYSQLKSFDVENQAVSQLGTQASDFPIENRPDVIVGSGTTDENGNFSISFLNDKKIGLIRDLTSSREYGAIRIAVDEDKYGSPDLIIFPQKGKTVHLPEEVVFPPSYTLEVTVKTDSKIVDQVLQPGAVVAGYPIQLSVLRDNYPSAANYPAESNIESYTALDQEIKGQATKVLDVGKTDEKGQYLFRNLLTPYFFSNKLSDQKFVQAMEQEIEGNLVYETQTVSITGDICNNCPVTYANYKLSRRNSVLKVGLVKRSVTIQPKNPQIYLRAVALQNGITKGIPYADVKISTYEKSNSLFASDTEYFKTDENGYLHIPHLLIKTEKQGSQTKMTGPFRSITLMKAGYTDLSVAKKQLIAFGERFPAQVEHIMTGGGRIVGQVVNEKGEPVVSYIRVGKGPYIKTASNGWYDVQDCARGWNWIDVVPCVDNYFSELLYKEIGDPTIISNENGIASTKTVLKEKLHRVQFKVVDENGKPVGQSCTTVGTNLSSCYPSNTYTGLTNLIAIASPANEFRVRTEAAGYVTHDDYYSIPIKKSPITITITLKRGQTISGLVVDAKTNQPIAGARVYTVTGTNEDGEVQTQTFTGADGKYTLSGVQDPKVWLAFAQYYSGLPVKVYAVKSGDKSYLRQENSVTGLNGVGTANFKLSAMQAKGELWGLPVEVNTAVQRGQSTLISGSFVKLPSSATLKLAQANAVLPFRDVEVTFKSAALSGFSGALDAPGSMVPVASTIDLETTALKMTAYGQYACEAIGTITENTVKKLTVSPVNGCGAVNGYLSSELAAFNFSYNYTGKFLLNTGIRVPGKPRQPQPLIGAANCPVSKDKFTLEALYGKSSFKIHEFEARMNGGSFDKDGFLINADVTTKIPLLSVDRLPAGQIKVRQNDILWTEYTGDLSLPLETWSIKGKGLRYDINQGGFRVLEGRLLTDLPQVPLKDLIIRPTAIDLGANAFSGAEQLTLGAVTPLKLNTNTKLALTYDAAAPFDQKPHYRINISNPSKTAAYISKIPGLNPGSEIKIGIISAYSDGKHKTVNVTPAKYRFFDVVSQEVTGIEVGDSYFTLIGNTDLEMPGANNNITGRFRYYKDAKDPLRDENNVVCQVEKLQTDVEMPGKVKFNGISYTLKKGELVVKGELLMYKNSIADAVKLPGIITKTPSLTKMDIPDQSAFKVGDSGNGRLVIQSGAGNKVEGKDWTLVKFTAKPTGFAVGGKETLRAGNDLIDFLVAGAISNDEKSGKQIAVDGIQTPFGGIKITLDFEKKILQGTLTLVSANIALGPVIIQDGTVDMQIDGKGFIMVGAITNAQLGIPLLDGFKSGIALGYYAGPLPSYMKSNLLNVSLYSKLPGMDAGLKGFYVNVMKSLGKEVLPKLPGPSLQDIPVVGSFVPVFDFSAGVDLQTTLNFMEKPLILVRGQAFAQASYLYNVADVCLVGLAAGADGNFQLAYENGALTGFIGFGINGTLIYCVGSANLGLDLKLEKTPTDFKPSVSLK